MYRAVFLRFHAKDADRNDGGLRYPEVLMQKVEEFLMPEREELTLPSGLKVTLRPINSLEFYAEMGWLPGQLANAVAGNRPGEMNAADLIEKTYRLIAAIVVSPKFALPVPDAMDPLNRQVQPAGTHHPRRLRDADRKAIDDWASKYLGFGGGRAALESFRKDESGAVPGPGASSGDVSPASERDPEAQPA